MYDYPAEILAVVDGDTLDILADKGTDDFKKMRIRLDRINAPEKNTAEGVKAKKWLEGLLKNEDGSFKHIYLVTVKDKKEKYGRYLGQCWLWGEDPRTVKSINDRLVEAGLAQYRSY